MSDEHRRALITFSRAGHCQTGDPNVWAWSKSGYAASRQSGVAHRLSDSAMAAVRWGTRLRFAGHWLCGGGSADVFPVPDPEAHGAICENCEFRWEELRLGGVAVVYRCVDASGQLLYVGSTGNGAFRRIDFHRKNAGWWTDGIDVRLEPFDSVDAARAAEARAIREESPEHNIYGRRRRSA